MRNLVDCAWHIGTTKLLCEREQAVARQRLSLLAEEGFDRAALLQVAKEASSNSWGEYDLLNTLQSFVTATFVDEALVSVYIVSL